jgi:hypothetical protein
VPAPKSTRRSRKRRKAGVPPGAAATPRRERGAAATPGRERGAAATPGRERGAAPTPGRERSAEQRVASERYERRAGSTLGVYGERPSSPFGPVPVSEIAILAGGVGVVVGLVTGAATARLVGVVVCALGVVEVTAREHFSGYRSHATLLAAVPAVGAGVALIALDGSSLSRELLLVVVMPVFAVLFWLLRKRFRAARQARVARPPAP